MKMNKKGFIILSVILIILIIFLSYNMSSGKNNAKNNYSNIKLYKRVSRSNDIKIEIKLDSKKKTKLIDLLKKQPLTESENPVNCMIIGTYSIEFNNYIIWFEKNGCTEYLTDTKKNTTYQIDLLNDIKNMIINLDKDEELHYDSNNLKAEKRVSETSNENK